MVVGFFAVKIVNLCSVKFQPSSGGSLYSMSGWNRRLSEMAMNPTLEPFKVAGDGLDELLFQTRERDQATVITVLAPINYELGHSFLPRSSPSLQPQAYSAQIVRHPIPVSRVWSWRKNGRWSLGQPWRSCSLKIDVCGTCFERRSG